MDLPDTPGPWIAIAWILWLISGKSVPRQEAPRWGKLVTGKPEFKRELPAHILIAVGALVLILFRRRPSLAWNNLQPTAELIGLALVVAGLAFTWWARFHLGFLWSPKIQRETIVDTGAFAPVRHPIYTGLLLATFGTALARGTVIGAAGALLISYGFYLKAQMEEAYARERLPAEAFDNIVKRIPMLLPFTLRRG